MTFRTIATRAFTVVIAIAVWALCAISAHADNSDANTETKCYYVLKLGNGETLNLNAHPDICGLQIEGLEDEYMPVLKGEALRQLLRREWAHASELLVILRKQKRELAYYKRGHTKMDVGYKNVVAFAKHHNEQIDKVAEKVKLLKKANEKMDRESTARKLQAKLHTIGPDNKKDKADDPTKMLTLTTSANGQDCNYAAAMKQLLGHDSSGSICKTDTKGNIFLFKHHKGKEGEYFGERFGRDGSYYQGYFNGSLQRHGNGFGVDTVLVKSGDWQSDSYTGQVFCFHPERIYGLDISRYEHDKSKPVKQTVHAKTEDGRDTIKTIMTNTVGIDWSDLRITHLGKWAKKIKGKVNYPVDFIFIKSTEGMDWKNRYYNADLDSCLAHNIPVSPYHFYSHKSTAKAQAANFIANGRINECTMRPMLDIEPSESQLKAMGGIDALLKGMVTFVDEVEKATGRLCVLYVNQSFLRSHWHRFPERLKQCDIWIAKYHEKHPYSKYLIWQFTDGGYVKGIVGDVDLNVFYGTRKDFDNWRKLK